MLAAGAFAVAAAGAAAHGAFHRNSPLFGRVLARLPDDGGAPAVARAFDDGPNPGGTPRRREARGEAGVQAT